MKKFKQSNSIEQHFKYDTMQQILGLYNTLAIYAAKMHVLCFLIYVTTRLL